MVDDKGVDKIYLRAAPKHASESSSNAIELKQIPTSFLQASLFATLQMQSPVVYRFQSLLYPQ